MTGKEEQRKEIEKISQENTTIRKAAIRKSEKLFAILVSVSVSEACKQIGLTEVRKDPCNCAI